MKNTLVLKLFRNSRDAVVCDLHVNGVRVLATSHPATLAAAMFVMDEQKFEFYSEKGFGIFSFPMTPAELGFLVQLLQDPDEAKFFIGFSKFSGFNFARPQFPGDTETDMHFRAAAHHLPSELRSILPSELQPTGFKKQLRKRNEFVYFPHC